MELYQLEYFRVLCKHGNFTSASEELMVTQPAVSVAIKKLEDEFHAALIDRDSKSFVLTHTGEIVLGHAIAIHNEIASLHSELNADFLARREVIRVAMPLTMCPKSVPDLLSSYVMTNQSITLNLLQKGHANIVKSLVDHSADIGIITRGITNPLLEQQEFIRVEIYACFSPDHPFCGCSQITPDMLQKETIIFPKMTASIPDYIQSYFTKYRINPKILRHDGFPDGNVRLAQMGKGIALTPKHLATENSAPLSPPMYCDLVVVWNKKDGLTKEQTDLIAFLDREKDQLQDCVH